MADEKPTEKPTDPRRKEAAKPAEATGQQTETSKQETGTPRQGTDTSSSTLQALPTEKPVLTQRPTKVTSQYVVTVNNQTGSIAKVERLDEVTGERTELSQAELAQIASMAGMDAGTTPTTATSTSPIQAYYQAYYQGYADYLQSVFPSR
jgi:hypothetical protein